MNKKNLDSIKQLFECNYTDAIAIYKAANKFLKEADLSIDTDLTKNTMSAVEEKILDMISISRSFENLEGIQLATTSNGNIHVTYNGSDIATINGQMFSEEEIDELRENGYYDDYNKMLSGEMGESENLSEAVVPASNLDFKHQQLGQVQDMIKVIAGLKAEDNSNTLYTELLDGYDKLIKILTDAITEDPVGTVVGDGFNTGLQSQQPVEEPVEDVDNNEELEEL